LAHHKSAKKRIKTNLKAKLKNHVIKKSIRTVTKRLHTVTVKQDAVPVANKLFSMLDKAAKKGVIHKNNVDRHKSRISKYINTLTA